MSGHGGLASARATRKHTGRRGAQGRASKSPAPRWNPAEPPLHDALRVLEQCRTSSGHAGGTAAGQVARTDTCRPRRPGAPHRWQLAVTGGFSRRLKASHAPRHGAARLTEDSRPLVPSETRRDMAQDRIQAVLCDRMRLRSCFGYNSTSIEIYL